MLIYQLKCFTDGFSTERRSRRRQIEKSVKVAAAHAPDEWILVIPARATPGEYAFIERLTAEHYIKNWRIVGRVELDNWLALMPDVEAYITRDLLREAARDLGMHQKMIPERFEDITELVRGAAKRADSIDNDWRVDFTRDGNSYGYRIRPKHSHAQQVNPIKISLHMRPDRHHAPWTSAFEDMIGFGTAGNVALPTDIVDHVFVSGPAWLSARHEGVAVEVGIDQQPLPPNTHARLRFIDHSGRTRGSFDAQVQHFGAGSSGCSIDLSIHGTTIVSLRSPDDPNSPAGYSSNIEFHGRMPSEALQLVALGRALRAGYDIELSVAGDVFGTWTWEAGASVEPEPEWVSKIEMLAQDLEPLQRHCQVYFPLPDTFSTRERVMIRFLRLLIEGKCVIRPAARSYTFTLTGDSSPEVEHMLSGQPFAIRLTSELDIEIFGHNLTIGELTHFHTQVVVDDHRKLLRALKSGRGRGMRATLRPINGESFRAYMPGLQIDPDMPLTVTPWGLGSLDERDR